ncbi:MAG: cysteine--tRNA ligase [Deltaproteobacteria bacterium]|nr:cysteine--tRNA ligase [Deltaproteobacteria bacterium]
MSQHDELRSASGAAAPGASASAAQPPAQPGLLAQIGGTPLVPMRKLCPNPRVEIWAKLERNNLGGSIKDRIGLWMIDAAERSGELVPGKTIIEPTSGNTGIGLATVAAIKGYPIVLAMSEGVSVERRKILAALGAGFLLTPAELGTDGAIERAYALAAEEPDKYYLPDQFNNPANAAAHYYGTAPEIWAQTGGRLTHFVAAMGTTGTLMGCSRRLREYDPKIRIIGVEPYLGHKIQGLKNLKEAYVPGIYDPAALDEKVNVEDEAAYDMARRLAREEGLLVGMSSGAALHVACGLARELGSGVIVTILPDGGERYLSTALFQVTEAAAPEQAPVGLELFNTLTRRQERFEPLAGGAAVGMYSCGPTVHARPHLGVLRRMLADDLVRRVLGFAGYEVRHVVSITDLDDNTMQAAEREAVPVKELCARYEAQFHEDLAALGILPAHVYARTSESVEQMIALTRELVERGYAYEKLRSVYFNIGRVPSYGELSGKDLGKIKVGATVDLERYEKDDPRDFTLLRRSTLGEMKKGASYRTEWGNVHPSWHVQCSAMARAELGARFDIHMASVDLIFPHNENEIAQSRALTGEPGARFWLHSELVLSGGKKVTYEEGTRVTLPDLLARGYAAREIRFFLLQTHYRQPLRLSDEAIEAGRASLRRIDECVRNLTAVSAETSCKDDAEGWIAETKEQFRRAIYDDLNVSLALAAVFRLVRQANYLMGQGRLCARHALGAVAALKEADQVLGVLPPEAAAGLPADVEALVAEREQARASRDFARADAIRAQLAAAGWVVEDRADGPRLRREG